MEMDDFLKEKETVVEQPKREWIPISITNESYLYPLFQQAMQHIKPGQTTLIATTINKERTDKLKQEMKDTFRFEFEWQDENVCGIDVFKKIEVNNG
jgi:hypothetical protein